MDSTTSAPRGSRVDAVTNTIGPTARRAVARNAPIFVILVGLLVWISFLTEAYFQPPIFLSHVQSAAPLMLLAAGESFVLVAGEFDLSIGALVTAVVAIAAGVGNDDGGRTWWLIPALLLFGVVVGLINGLVATKLRVPSFIGTLGMQFVLVGAINYWTGGAVLGFIPTNLRAFGRGRFTDVPWVQQVPYAVVIMIVVVLVAAWIRHGTDFGHRLLAVGANPTAARMSGISVDATRILAFVISAVLAVIAGIVLGGIVGVSNNAGQGYEFQAIIGAMLGGVVLGGGRGAVVPAALGAFALGVLFSLLNLLGFDDPVRQAVEGLIIIVAVAITFVTTRRHRA